MAEIKVNKAQLDAVSEERRRGVVSALQEAGVLKPGDVLVGDEGVSPVRLDPEDPGWGGDVPDDVVNACWAGAELAMAACTAQGGHEVQCGQLGEQIFRHCIEAHR
jgi:hypothetical protein